MHCVTVRNAFKSYGKNYQTCCVLNGINLTVNYGSIYALIGASGCGKTTLLSSVIGARALDSGEIFVFGEKIVPNQMPSSCLRIGFMPQEMSLYNEFTPKEALTFYGNIFQMDTQKLEKRVEMLTKLLELPDSDRRISECSGGQQRRISLAVTMIHEPDLLILDEPSVGLDPILRESIWKFLVDLTKNNKVSILVTTHYIEEARQAADRCGLMRNGILLDEDSPQAILERHNCENLDDVFLKLCYKQETSSILQGHHDNSKNHKQSIEMQEIPEKDEKVGPPSEEVIKTRKYFHMQTLKALTYKSYIQVLRQPMAYLMLFISIFDVVVIEVGVGGNPRGLKIGIVNHEIRNFQDCKNSSLITVLNDGENCNFHMISCRYLDQITSDIGDKIFYENYADAYADVKTGKIMTIIKFAANFSSSSQEVLKKSASDEELNLLLESYQIEIVMDQSQFQETLFLKKKLYTAYEKYSSELLKDCGFNEKSQLSPMNFMPPIYGDHETNFKVFTTPLASMCFVFFGAAIITVTNIIDDRKNGSWSRTFMCGVEILEVITAHLIVNFALIFLNVFGVLFLLYFYHPEVVLKSSFASISMFILSGVLGMQFGLFFACYLESFYSAAMVGHFYAQAHIFLAGILWPLHGRPKIFQYFITCTVFLTQPVASLSDIIFKNYNLKNLTVWYGFIAYLIYIIMFLILSAHGLKKKKFV